MNRNNAQSWQRWPVSESPKCPRVSVRRGDGIFDIDPCPEWRFYLAKCKWISAKTSLQRAFLISAAELQEFHYVLIPLQGSHGRLQPVQPVHGSATWRDVHQLQGPVYWKAILKKESTQKPSAQEMWLVRVRARNIWSQFYYVALLAMDFVIVHHSKFWVHQKH